ncbi:serine/threonine protein kinase [Streptosporangium album]|uniref:Serine/threonine protein kinase n=1 Tax=Streptosporangium album TaxID=47479 RepID=A0A7W7S1Z0_9ACTN|nr:protein kinase [Streptosporangium album]MBB4942400.1 serine/threonine protein kinase [Streptosporangium album]
MDPLRQGDPERIGGYRIVGRLGEGGQGVVYLAETEAGDRVAVKVVHGRLADGPSFARELAAARQVAEFCTVRILDADLEAVPPYIVSEYIDGPSLQQVVESHGPRHGAVLHRLAIGTITALAAIHRAGVIHRDFKPDNVSPSRPATDPEAPLPAPSTPVELVSAIDASLAISPEATFSYAGGYTQSDIYLEASGRIVHHGTGPDRIRTDFDMRMSKAPTATGSRVVVVDEKYYVVGRKTYLYKEVDDRGELPGHLLSGWYATHIVATGSVKTILELVAASRQVRRVKRVYPVSSVVLRPSGRG